MAHPSDRRRTHHAPEPIPFNKTGTLDDPAGWSFPVAWFYPWMGKKRAARSLSPLRLMIPRICRSCCAASAFAPA